MIETLAPIATGVNVEDVLRDELASGDSALVSYGPILRHLLASDEQSVFSDEIIARVRGMTSDLARQLLDELSTAAGNADVREHDRDEVEALIASFVVHPALLTHCHALALEWQLTERVHARLALDPVLSPLLQALIASPDNATATASMALLASQARFIQAQRRMKLPLVELPGDLLHVMLVALRAHAAGDADTEAKSREAEAAIRARYDEGRSRIGIIARLVTAMGGGATAALSVTHAGVAIFTSALALVSGQDRDLAILATTDGQLARLALSLRAAGLKPSAVEEQFVSLHPDVAMPGDFDQLGADRAAALLARSTILPGA
ncbi:MAG: hypothetical protein KGM49_12905 [Sphingomonadales bacterium]|nr:hypothetical protein [Sphingomonadales bacterium]